jgi:hypothetical protein
MTDNQETLRAVEAKLLSLFTSVNDWLKFAETKHGGIIVFSGAAITAIVSLSVGNLSIPHYWKTGLFVGSIILGLTTLVSLWSFLPRTNLEKILKKKKAPPVETDNLYFFSHVYKYSAAELIDSITHSYMTHSDCYLCQTRNNLDIAAQVIANAYITAYKLRLFTIAVWLAFSGLLIIPVVSLLHYLVG